jgi:hypothetical protein
MRRTLYTLLSLVALCATAAHATSTIDPTQPRQSTPSNPSPLTSAPVRNNFLAAYNDINNILGKFSGTVSPANPIAMQDWVDTTASPVYKFKFWNPTTSTWTQWGTLNISTGVFSTVATSSSFAATPPITVGFSGGVATYGLNIDSNFAVSGGNLALASVANGHLIANCSGGSAEPGNCSWTTFADQAIGATNGMLPYRSGGAWGNISTGVSGGTIPLNNTANVFSNIQSIYTNLASIPAVDAGTLFSLANVDGTQTRIELTTAGSFSSLTGRASLGTMSVPLTLTSGSLIIQLGALGYDGSSWVTSATNGAFRIYAEGTWSNTSHPTEVCESTTPSGSLVIADQWCVHASGGATLGSPSGGDQGAGTLNLQGNLYSNGTAPTGTGGYARSISPVLTTPSLGVATATSVNGLIIANNGSTNLSIASGKTLTANNSITLSGTDSTTMTFPTTSATIARTDAGQTFSGAQTMAGGLTVNSSFTATGLVGLGSLVIGTQDTALGYWGSTSASAISVNNCTNALTYSTSTHTFGCNAGAGTGTVTNVATAGLATGGPITVTGTVTVTAVAKSDQQTGTSNVLAVTPLHQQDHDSAIKVACIWTGATVGTNACNGTSSFNVTNVTRVSAGDYTVNFTTAFATTNYACTVTPEGTGTIAAALAQVKLNGRLVGSVEVVTFNSSTGASGDATTVSIHCTGRQ